VLKEMWENHGNLLKLRTPTSRRRTKGEDVRAVGELENACALRDLGQGTRAGKLIWMGKGWTRKKHNES